MFHLPVARQAELVLSSQVGSMADRSRTLRIPEFQRGPAGVISRRQFQSA